MHNTLFMVLKTKHNLSIFEPEIKNPLSIFEPVGQNEYAYKKKNMYKGISVHGDQCFDVDCPQAKACENNTISFD